MADYRATINFLLHQIRAVGSFAASTTQAQGNGTLDYGFTRCSVVGSANDALTLPTARADAWVTVFNDDSAETLELWAGSGDRIDLGSVDGSILVSPQQRITLVATNSIDWYTVHKTPTVDLSVTAFAGGGQGSATLLTAEWNRVDTVATNGDSVKLPDAKIGIYRSVYNDDSAQYLELFPNTSDRINDRDVNTGIIVSPNSGVILQCFSTGVWHTFARDLPTVPTFIASAVQSQGEAPVRHGRTDITTVATNGDAVTLPGAYVGNHCVLFNADLGQYAAVYPESGDAIDSLGTDNPLYLFPGQTVEFTAASVTQWYTKPSPIASVLTIAAAGTTIATATQLIADWNIVSSSTPAVNDGVVLPAASVGRTIFIHNDDDTNAVNIYPFNDTLNLIDDNAAGVSISLAADATIVLRAISAIKWRSNIT